MTTNNQGAAVARLVIPNDFIVPGVSAAIPLQVIPLTGDAAPGDPASPDYKIGIEVVLANPQTGGATDPILYEFDTGGEGFFASVPTASAGGFTPAASLGQVYTQYFSGITYTGNAQVLRVSLPGAVAYVAEVPVGVDLSVESVVGQVTELGEWRPGKKVKWPIFGHFYGDFGASLQATTVQTTPATDQPANTVSMLSMLLQLPMFTAQSAGFIVDVGPYPGGAVSSGRVIVGLTPALRSLFGKTVKMNSAGSYTPATLSGAFNTFSEVPIAGQVQVAQQQPQQNVGILFDTGAPPITFHPGPNLPESYAPQNQQPLVLTAADEQGGTATLLDIIVGDVPCQTQAGMAQSPSANDPQGYVNTGLAPFFANPIMFDLANGVIGFV